MVGVYRITNNKNGLFYIGSSIDIEYRWRKHKESLRVNRHYNKHLQSSWNLYGEECFIFEVLEEVSVDNLILREQHYLDSLQPFNENGYNSCPTAGSPLGHKHSEESKEKISEAGKGRVWSEETRKKIIEKLTGKKRNEEQKKRFSEAQKKRYSEMSDEELENTKNKIKENFAKHRKPLSDEARLKISQTLKGRKRPKEFCEKMSKLRTGKKLSEETKEKLREIAKNRREKNE